MQLGEDQQLNFDCFWFKICIRSSKTHQIWSQRLWQERQTRLLFDSKEQLQNILLIFNFYSEFCPFKSRHYVIGAETIIFGIVLYMWLQNHRSSYLRCLSYICLRNQFFDLKDGLKKNTYIWRCGNTLLTWFPQVIVLMTCCWYKIFSKQAIVYYLYGHFF